MNDLLGLSIGTTNFVAVRAGHPPVLRRSLLTLSPHRRPELGMPAPHPGAGLLITGFVERVGDRQPLVADDGSTHVPDLLLVDAIDSMVAACGAGDAGLCLAVPAYWPPQVWQGLREALVADTDRAMSARSIAPPCLVPDVVAALTELDSEHGVASCGLVAVLDFGGGGTSITLVDAASGFRPITETVRYRRFSGNLTDQAIVAHILDETGSADATVPGGTATVGDLAQLTDACRQAKEQLSGQNATEVRADLPGRHDRIGLTRAELEQLIRDPLDGVVAALEHLLDLNRLNWRNLAAVAAVGGGAQIPLVSQRLSAGRRVPVVTSARPVIAAAIGAALSAGQPTGRATGPATATSTAPAPTLLAPMAPTAMAPAADTVDLPSRRGAEDPGANDLAWSQEEIHGQDVMPLVDRYDDDFGGPPDLPGPRSERVEEARPSPGLPRLPRMVLGLVGALVAAATVLAIFYALTNPSHGRQSQTTSTVTVPATPPGPGPAEPPGAPIPPPSSAAAPSSAAPPPPVTTAAPPPATTREQATATTTQPPTTTTTTTTTAPTTTPPATTEPVTTEPVTTTVLMTTEYLNIPFVPVPIPIQVPEN